MKTDGRFSRCLDPRRLPDKLGFDSADLRRLLGRKLFDKFTKINDMRPAPKGRSGIDTAARL